jgi:tRNA(Ile)-lysidine synthase
MKGPAQIDWRSVAGEVAQRLPRTVLHAAAMQRADREFRNGSRRSRRPSRWAVAFSGGADSLALLLILWAEGKGRPGRDLVALHFNHRLRGRAADADERFCRQVCHALGVTFVSGRWRKPRRGASEAEARAARFDFFHREMKRRKLRLLWLGHQQDDIAETLLMRLARGSGPAGLAAPRPVQSMPADIWHLRPLLTLKKSEIAAALRRAGAVWREDATNRAGSHFRNRVRRSVLPAWIKAAGRDALAGAALSRELLEEDDTALEELADRTRALRGGVLDVASLRGSPRALVRRLLHRWLLAVRVQTDLSRQGFGQLLRAVEQGRATRFSLGRTGFAVIRRGKLRFE